MIVIFDEDGKHFDNTGVSTNLPTRESQEFFAKTYLIPEEHKNKYTLVYIDDEDDNVKKILKSGGHVSFDGKKLIHHERKVILDINIIADKIAVLTSRKKILAELGASTLEIDEEINMLKDIILKNK